MIRFLGPGIDHFHPASDGAEKEKEPPKERPVPEELRLKRLGPPPIKKEDEAAEAAAVEQPARRLLSMRRNAVDVDAADGAAAFAQAAADAKR